MRIVIVRIERLTWVSLFKLCCLSDTITQILNKTIDLSTQLFLSPDKHNCGPQGDSE